MLSYSRPVIGGGSVDNYDSALKTDGRALDEGYLALQSESHPIQFRQVQLRRIEARE